MAGSKRKNTKRGGGKNAEEAPSAASQKQAAPDEEPLRIVGIGSSAGGLKTFDIDSQKQAASDLTSANEQLEYLSRFPQENPNPVMRVGRNGTLLYANAACSMLGIKCQTGEVLPERYRRVVAEVLNTGSHRVIEAGGQERIFTLEFVPSLKAGYVNIYGSDITERKKTEEKLLFQVRVWENVRDAVFATDAAFKITAWNKAAADLYGWTSEEVIGKDSRQILRSSMTEDERRALLETLSAQGSTTYEITHTNKDGRSIDIEAKLVTLADDAGRVTGYIAANRDISVRKRVEEELKKAHDELEKRVRERTAELLQTNARLQEEIEERVHTEQALRLEEARLDALFRLSEMSETSADEMASFILEHGIALTRSKIGFVGFISEDESVYTLNAVSKDVVKECNVTGDPMQWHLAEAGIWADAVRKRRTLFLNDYSKPYASKKGLPPGHPPVTKLMVVPISDGHRIVAVAGMGNKASDYDESDERQIALLLHGMWNRVQSNRSREELREAYGELEQKVGERTAELAALNAVLRQSQQDLNRAQEVAQTGSWRMDVQHNKLLWSDENYRIFGIPEGMPLTYETFLSCVHPEDREYVDKKWQAALQGKKYDIEHRIMVGDEVKWVREKAEIEFDERGMLKGGFGTTQDNTERKKAEEDLRQTRDYLDHLFTYANAPIIVWDPELKITRFNRAFERLTGRKADEVLGKKVDILVPAQKRDEALQKINRTIGEGERWEVIEVPIQHVDGSVRTVLWNSATLFKADGKTPLATIAQGQDITELKETDRIKDEFIGLVSHELRTPLTVIVGSLRSAISPEIPPQDRHELIQNAIEGAESLAATLENMLELSRHQAGRLQLNVGPVAISGVTRSVIGKLRDLGARQRFLTDFPGRLPPVEADPVRVERILYNLLENAIKYSPGESEIRAFARSGGDFVVTGVADQGRGISSDDVGKLFELFERLETRPLTQGLGLGLVVCKRLVEAQGGHIWVESEPGKGATFYFTLPKSGKKP